MNDERFEDLFNEKKVQAPKLKPGDRIDAVVAGISGENIFLDIGGKSEGVLNAGELRNDRGELEVKPGDTVNVFYLSTRGGNMQFTTRLGSGQTSVQELEDAFLSGIPVEGRVTSEIKGGFEVIVAGQRGFCPYSQMDIRRVEDPDDYLEKVLQFRIIEFSGQGKNIILSARSLIEEEREQQKSKLRKNLKEGDRIKGTVSSLRDFGAFVDIGGIDGLIPVSELAWGQVDRVEDILTRGQQVEAVVSRLDWDHDRITLSLRETLENPWDQAADKFPLGSVHIGRVSRLTTFGAFVTLEPGIDGLLHISKLGAGRRINHPREVLESGQELTVRIEEVDKEKKRISLAPEDYEADEKSTPQEVQQKIKQSQPKSFGTLGDLLKSQLKKKKSGSRNSS
ncbi:MAG: 30S ribosomal protein S1 [Desulfobulbaceae bacterium]|nr:30S ribosomal protein S1 [Desulfobulbaceae bacterium]